MSTHVSVEAGADGGTLACKRATADGGVASIRAEARRLATIDHPGVIRFVELRESADGPILVTEYVGPRTLATIGPVPTDRAARLIADLASTVADLHALGVVHGRLHPDHVLVAGDRVVLCSFAADTQDHQPPDDVLGIGLSLRALLHPDLEEEPIPDRRPWRRVPWQGYRQRALLTLADQATDDDPGRRPAARALADTIGDLLGAPGPRTIVPGPAPAGTPAISRRQELVDLVAIRLRRRSCPPRPAGRSRPPRRALVLGALGAVVVAVGAVGATDRTARPPATATVVASTVLPVCSPPSAAVAADLDGDGCPNGVRIGPGWIEVDDERFRVGRVGDALQVGDWDGDGRATVALLRPDVDEVWLFPTWDPAAAVTARFAGRFPDSDGLVRRSGPDRDILLVRHPDGTTTEVPGS